MSMELIFLAGCLSLVVLMFLFRKNPYVKKYWKITLILLPAVAIVVLKVLKNSRNNKTEKDLQDGADELAGTIAKVKDDLTEVNLTTAVEVTIAKTKDAETIKELKKVIAIPDKRERRKKLADMIG